MQKLTILIMTISLVCFLGCSSTTVIRSTDPEARIYIDGEFAGKGEVIHSDQKIVGTSTEVTLKRDGCDPAHYHFSRNERVDVGAIIGGILVLFPFFWTMKYKPERTYEYNCDVVNVPELQQQQASL